MRTRHIELGNVLLLPFVLLTTGSLNGEDDLSVSSQWGRTSHRNNVYDGDLPLTWEATDKHGIRPGRGVRWRVEVRTRTYPYGFRGDPAVAGGRVYVGSKGIHVDYLERDYEGAPPGLMLCFRESNGEFLWQFTSPRLASRPSHDVEDSSSTPIASTPLVDGERLWFVSNRCEVVCLDSQGFQDGQNDGPYEEEPHQTDKDADVVWKFDMIGELGVSPRLMSNCSVTAAGDAIFVCTSNGFDERLGEVAAPQAPSFIALDKNNGQLLWADNSPGANILDGQWTSPAYGVMGGVPQVVFAGGDAWIYSFDPEGDGRGNSRLLWKFDCNSKDSLRIPKGLGERHSIVASPVIYEQRVYAVLGETRDLATGLGRLWCIDPTKRGDVSPELVFNRADPTRPIAHKRLFPCEPKKGDFIEKNPNSAAVWCFQGTDLDRNGELTLEETMHGGCSSPAIKDGLLLISDDDACLHCVDVKTGEAVWNHDVFSMINGSPLISRHHAYVGTEDGRVIIFEFGRKKKVVAEIEMPQSIEGTPVAADGILYLTTPYNLYSISGED